MIPPFRPHRVGSSLGSARKRVIPRYFAVQARASAAQPAPHFDDIFRSCTRIPALFEPNDPKFTANPGIQWDRVEGILSIDARGMGMEELVRRLDRSHLWLIGPRPIRMTVIETNAQSIFDFMPHVLKTVNNLFEFVHITQGQSGLRLVIFNRFHDQEVHSPSDPKQIPVEIAIQRYQAALREESQLGPSFHRLLQEEIRTQFPQLGLRFHPGFGISILLAEPPEPWLPIYAALYNQVASQLKSLSYLDRVPNNEPIRVYVRGKDEDQSTCSYNEGRHPRVAGELTVHLGVHDGALIFRPGEPRAFRPSNLSEPLHAKALERGLRLMLSKMTRAPETQFTHDASSQGLQWLLNHILESLQSFSAIFNDPQKVMDDSLLSLEDWNFCEFFPCSRSDEGARLLLAEIGKMTKALTSAGAQIIPITTKTIHQHLKDEPLRSVLGVEEVLQRGALTWLASRFSDEEILDKGNDETLSLLFAGGKIEGIAAEIKRLRQEGIVRPDGSVDWLKGFDDYETEIDPEDFPGAREENVDRLDKYLCLRLFVTHWNQWADTSLPQGWNRPSLRDYMKHDFMNLIETYMRYFLNMTIDHPGPIHRKIRDDKRFYQWVCEGTPESRCDSLSKLLLQSPFYFTAPNGRTYPTYAAYLLDPGRWFDLIAGAVKA